MQRSPLLLLFLFVFISCDFEPEGTYLVELTEPTEAPPLEADLNLLTDTVNFYWASSVWVRLNMSNQKIQNVKFYLDDKEVFVTKDQNSYKANLNFTQPGTHKFKMIVIVSSGTGSMADLLGAESFQYSSKEWTLIAQSLNTNTNLSYKIDNDGLSFSWKKYDGIDFKSYRIKELSTRNTYDIETNSFRNTNYAGEQSFYEVYVLDNQNIEHLWGRCSLNKNLPVLRIGNINNQIALTWNTTPFKNNISEYQVFKRVYPGSWSRISTLSNSDTSLILTTLDNVFAQKMDFYLYCVPAQAAYIDNTSLFSSFLNSAYLALTGPKFENPVNSDCSGFYFYSYSSSLQKNILYKYINSADQVRTIHDYKFFYDISPNSKYLLITGDSIVDLYDLTSNSVVKSVNILKIASGYYPSVYPKISDNGICVFNTGNVVYIYDFLNESLIATKNAVQGAMRISTNGKYFTLSNADSLSIYRINANSIDLLSSLKGGPFGYTQYNFFPDQDEYLYLYVRPVMKIMSSNDFSVIRSMNIGEYFFNIDFCSQKILTAKDASTWNIYDLNTGNLLQTIRTEIGTGASNYTLINQNTIFRTGYKYFLNN